LGTRNGATVFPNKKEKRAFRMDIGNADRFTGFAGLYDAARPAMPLFPVEIITAYLGKRPGLVVDMGCGTGLSTLVWKGRCAKAVGIDPNDDMLEAAAKKRVDGITFKKGCSHDTGLADASADAVVCSQSFHWMEPAATLAETARILRSGGVFAAVDCDWPPVCGWRAEKAFIELIARAEETERSDASLRGRFVKWDKEKHLTNIINSGYFRFAREIVFSNAESCDAERFVGLALSQGSIQSIIKLRPGALASYIDAFRETVFSEFGRLKRPVHFCYRMRIAVK